MCGRFSLRTDPGRLFEEFGLHPPADYRPRYNIAPTQDVLILRMEHAGPALRYVRWGLVPWWSREESGGARLINARAESVANRPAFRDPFKQRRCLVLADGFYEWGRLGDRRQPVRVHLEGNRPFAMAGLWDRWRPRARASTAEPPQTTPPAVESCTIITTRASLPLHHIHDRMPVLLDRQSSAKWLSTHAHARDLQETLIPYAGEDLTLYPVSTIVNSPANDVPECCDPL